MSIGGALAKARQELGLTVTQVSSRTRIRETVIRAIERDDYSLCGGDFYTRGHVRSIARCVGLDPEPLIRAYDEAHGGAPQMVSALQVFEAENPVRFRERRSPNWSAAMAVALVVVVLYGIFKIFSGDTPSPEIRTSRPAAAEPIQPPAAPPPSPNSVALAPRKDVTIRLKAKENSWVNVRDNTGRQLFSGIIRAGEVKQWKAPKRIRLLIGNGGRVTVTVNGKGVGAPGKVGQVVRLSFGPEDPAPDTG